MTLAISGNAFAQNFDIRICMIDAFETNVIQSLKCYEDLDPSLNILRRQINALESLLLLNEFRFHW